jgi:hypothetical protein
MSKRLSSSSTASTASMKSDNSDIVEGTVFLTPDAERAFEIEDSWRGLTPTKNESYYVKKNHGNEYPIYKATTQKNGDMKVEYYTTMKRSWSGSLKSIEEKEQGYETITIKKDAVDNFWKLYGELVEAKNKEDGKSWWSTEEEKKKIKSLEDQLKENPFGKLQSDMTLYVGGKKKQSRKQKKSLKRKPRKQKKSLKKRR